MLAFEREIATKPLTNEKWTRFDRGSLLGFKDGDFPNAEAYYEGAISLPMYATLTDDEQGRVLEALGAAFERSAA